MSGRIVGSTTVPVFTGKQKVTIPLDMATYTKLVTNGSALISFETPNNEVQAVFQPERSVPASFERDATFFMLASLPHYSHNFCRHNRLHIQPRCRVAREAGGFI